MSLLLSGPLAKLPGGGATTLVASDNTATATASSSITVNNPTNVSGDLIVHLVASQNNRQMTTPSGYALRDTIESYTGTSWVQIFTKISGGSEPSTVAISSGAGTDDRAAVSLTFRNTDATTVTIGTENLTDPSTTINCDSITATAGNVVLEVYAAFSSITKASAVINNHSTRNLAVLVREDWVGGAVGAQTATQSTSAWSCGCMVELSAG